MFDIQKNLKYLEDSIIAFEQEPVEKGKILFYGHSCLPGGTVIPGATAGWMRISG